MSSRLIIDGNSVYEIDEECEKRKSAGQIQKQSVQESKERIPIPKRTGQEKETDS